MKQSVLEFGGVDYTPGAQPGQWEDTENVSCRDYPALVPRESREILEDLDDETALYVYDKIARVIGTEFFYDGQKICNVSPGRKQICTVGNQIIIYPDKICYTIGEGTAPSTEMTIPIPYSQGVRASGKRLTVPETGIVYSSTNRSGETLTGRGQIQASLLNPTVTISRNFTQMTVYFSSVRVNDTIIIHDDYYGTDISYTVTNVQNETRHYWPATDGYINRQYVTLTFGRDIYDPVYARLVWEEQTLGGWAYAPDTTIYTENIEPEPTTGKYLNEFEVGDKLRAVNDPPSYERVKTINRTLYTDHYYYTGIETRIYEGQTITYAGMDTIVDTYSITPLQKLRLTAGNISIDTHMTSYDTTNGRWMEFADPISELNGKSITIQRVDEDEPDLEYICTHNNRLWGVANNKIYASAWGDPTVFSTETQTQVDPWSSEVAEDGEWTGIVSYSGTLLAFKEHIMYKVIGTLPENYTVYTYHVEGIKRGCHKSAVIIGEVLYYLGPNGVYAYTGSVPERISGNFGTRVYSDGVGGTDGLRYYLSARRGSEWDLHVLDVEKGIWLREDDTEIIDFARSDRPVVASKMTAQAEIACRVNSETFLMKTDNALASYHFFYDAANTTWKLDDDENPIAVDINEYGITVYDPSAEPEEEEEESEEEEETEPTPEDGDVIDVRVSGAGFYALCANGETVHFNSGNEVISWRAVTAKLYEDIRTQYVNIPIEHHSYSRFVIRIELAPQSTFNVEISYDGEEFTPCYKQLASRRQTYTVPIIPRRCDNMRIRLSGTGWFWLLGIVRVVHEGSAL